MSSYARLAGFELCCSYRLHLTDHFDVEQSQRDHSIQSLHVQREAYIEAHARIVLPG